LGGRRSRGGEESIVYSHTKEKIELVLYKRSCDLNTSGRITFTCSESEFSEKSAELTSTCEEAPRSLSSGKGDYTQVDRIRLKRGVGNETGVSLEESESGSVDMPGPVLDISVAEKQKAASAVVKNLSTGSYEVYRITAVCSN
jgi:hypothetical protein